MALSIIRSLKDAALFAQDLKEYFSLRNKVLWEGETDWTSGSQIVPGIKNYRTIVVYPWIGYNGVVLERTDDVTFKGAGLVGAVSSVGVHTSETFVLKVGAGDVVARERAEYMHHRSSSAHDGWQYSWIRRIVGKEPEARFMEKFLGGGTE